MALGLTEAGVVGGSGIAQHGKKSVRRCPCSGAGGAPGYSIAASTVVAFGAVARSGPGRLLYRGVEMVGIVCGSPTRGEWRPTPGPAVRGPARALVPQPGCLVGWKLVVSAPVGAWCHRPPTDGDVELGGSAV
ncbi:MAG: hypothetical protein ACYCYK_13450 [Candidatus Dormibacteria bacterium]